MLLLEISKKGAAEGRAEAFVQLLPNIRLTKYLFDMRTSLYASHRYSNEHTHRRFLKIKIVFQLNKNLHGKVAK